MKTSTIFCVWLAIIIVAPLLFRPVSRMLVDAQPIHVSATDSVENNENMPISGMYFNVGYVLAHYQYNGAYCIIYDDADANLFEATIFVDTCTYASIAKAIATGSDMQGHMIINDTLSTDSMKVFSFKSNIK